MLKPNLLAGVGMVVAGGMDQLKVHHPGVEVFRFLDVVDGERKGRQDW